LRAWRACRRPVLALPASPAQRQELAAATMTAMIASLDNNHARWSYLAPPPGDVPGDLGIMTSPAPPLADIAPQEARHLSAHLTVACHRRSKEVLRWD